MAPSHYINLKGGVYWDDSGITFVPLNTKFGVCLPYGGSLHSVACFHKSTRLFLNLPGKLPMKIIIVKVSVFVISFVFLGLLFTRCSAFAGLTEQSRGNLAF